MAFALKLLLLVGLSCGLLMGADATKKKGYCHKKKGCCQSCGEGWIQLNGRCFVFVHEMLDWCSAEKECQKRGGNLASIHSDVDYKALRGLIKVSTGSDLQTWVGGTDAVAENCWLWSDGSEFDRAGFNWGPGEPNNFGTGEHCLELNYNKKDWANDWKCDSPRPFICGKDKEDQEPDEPI